MANFTFVTHKGARPEKKELVKSHVMRESQRKRREAKQHRQQDHNVLHPPPQPHSGSGDQGPDSRMFVPAQLSLPFHTILPRTHPAGLTDGDADSNGKLDTSLIVRPLARVSPSPSNAGDRGSNVPCRISKTTDSRGERRYRRQVGALVSAVFSEMFSSESFGRERVTSDQPSHSDTPPQYDHSTALTQQPPIPSISTPTEFKFLDPSWLPGSLFDRMSELCNYYGSTLFIEQPGYTSNEPINYWPQVAATGNDHIILVSAAALLYCAYRDTAKSIPSNDDDYFKDCILGLINKALENPETAVSDDTIAAVLSVCMYENVRGNDVIVTHLQGLHQMIEIRKEMDGLNSGLGLFIQETAIFQDMMHATCSNVLPIMFDIGGPILRDSSRRYCFDTWFRNSPLRSLNDAAFVAPIPELRSSFGVLKDAFDGFEMLCTQVFDPDTASGEANSFKLRYEAIWARLQRGDDASASGMPTSTTGKVEEAVRLTARIHFRAVVEKIRHDDEINTDDVKKLHAITRRIDLGFFKVAPYVFLWIILTGGAASTKQPLYRPHFVSEMLRLGECLGIFDWESFSQAVGNFLWLQQYLRGH
ncbi:hypothetical protein P280DRAFT_516856 [Massarina eburnea CBS 473.64]|uniref:Uncharacterized protein n=1 Tax=Massarina eburnea CBS 473.64 TaxID=1395130 RepID=A0A6A6S6N5_9PLEO|nr:hypothetical protein P280DRAFT_516856 [Massarina eburnea CBS 473.64]